MLTLQVREIGEELSGESPEGTGVAEMPADEQNIWRDSSLDLQQGLDVVELSIERQPSSDTPGA